MSTTRYLGGDHEPTVSRSGVRATPALQVQTFYDVVSFSEGVETAQAPPGSVALVGCFSTTSLALYFAALHLQRPCVLALPPTHLI